MNTTVRTVGHKWLRKPESLLSSSKTFDSWPRRGATQPALILLELPFVLDCRPSWIRTSHKRVLRSLFSFANLLEITKSVVVYR